jgi:hypothetical protein
LKKLEGESMLEKIKVDDAITNTSQLVAIVEEHGYALVSTADYEDQSRNSLFQKIDSCLARVVQPIQIFEQYPRWRPIGVKTERPPTRSEGVGESPLHMDFVNAADPPDFVVLYCERPDPAGGGDTILAPTSIAESLSPEIRAVLARPYFSDGRVINLKNIGEDINPFAVLTSEGEWQFRYTAQLLTSPLTDSQIGAVQALDAALRSNMIAVSLSAGEGVIIDQHKTVHGRLPLGGDQEVIEVDKRRLVWQRFGRRRSA